MTTAALARLVLESLPQAISAIDAEGRFVFANAAFWRDVDVTPEACPPGSPVREVVRLLAYRGRYGPGDPEAQVAAVMAIDRKRPTRRLITMPDASRSLEITSVPLADGGYINIGHDVTALVHAREEQAARARLLDSTLAHLRSGVVRFDAALRVSVCNPTYDVLVGLPGGSVRPGMTHRDIVGQLDRHGELATSDEAQEILAALERNRAAAGTRERRRPSGEVLRFDTRPTPDGGCLVEATDITALKHAEDEARRRAAQLDGMLAALPHGVCVYGPDRRVQMLNAAYQRLLGDGAVALGDRLEDIVAARLRSGEYDAATAAAVLARFAPATTILPPMRRQRPSGLVLENCMARMPDGGVISVFTDVTALHQAEEAERQRAVLLDGVLEALPHGVCVYGPDRRVAMVNEAYRRIMAGAPIAVGEHIEEIAARRIAAGEFSADYVAEVLANPFGRDGQLAERVRRRANGTAIAVRAAPLPGGGHISVVTDVTALHAAQQELRHRAAMQAAMLGTIRHGIILYGPDRRVLATNAKTAELTGIPPDRLLPGRKMDDLLDEQVARGHITSAQAAAMKAYDRSLPLRYTRDCPDGRVLDTVSEPTPDGGFVITYSDVTEERTIRAELERARALAESASEAKTRFLATMSHELRTPLNVVIGLSEALGRERDLTRTRDYAEMINEAGRHLLQLVDDILDVARSQADALAVANAPICSAEVIAAALAAALPLAEAGRLSLAVELGDGLPALRGDARRLRQVLDKLLSNALKFTPPGGRITVSAAIEAGDLAIRVADTGIGIPAEERERMFEPFTQLDNALSRKFPGSGLGLHLARTLTIALGGELTLEQPPGPGTVAVLRFPSDRLLPISEPVPQAAGALPA